MRSIVYFGSRLSRDEFCDDEIRAERLRRGLTIVGAVPGVRSVQPLGAACAVIVHAANLDAVREAIADVGEMPEESDRPMFIAAGGATC